MIRVVKPGGIVAVWWKVLSGEDPVKMLRDDVAADLGADPLPSGLAGGFKEFYAAPLTDHMLRVIPWQTMIGLEELIVSERSRKIVRDRLRIAGGGILQEVRASPARPLRRGQSAHSAQLRSVSLRGPQAVT